jgi:long-chain fatty acid transport protein
MGTRTTTAGIAGLATALAAGTLAKPAQANGFFVPQQSASTTGRVFAGEAAIARDASTVFANPAGMTELARPELMAGLALILPSVRMHDRGSTAAAPGSAGAAVGLGTDGGGNAGRPTPLPSLFASTPIVPDQLWFGLALTTPFGQSLEYEDEFFGRYDSLRSQLRTFDMAPSLAWRASDWLSLGGGIDVQAADAELTNALPDPLAPGGPSPATDGRALLDGSGFGFGFNLGALIKPWQGGRIGLHYRSAVEHELDGTATLRDLAGPLAALNGEVDASSRLDLPEIWTVALAQELGPDWTLLGQFQWFGWSRFDALTIGFADGRPEVVRRQDYRDSFMLGVGAEYRLDEAWTLRGGIQYDRTPTTDGARNTSLPDGDRIWLGLGASWRWKDAIWLDVGWAHVEFASGEVDLSQTFYAGTPLATTVQTKGEASTRVDTVSLSLRVRF